MDIHSLIAKVKTLQGSRVSLPGELPSLEKSYTLPADLKQFYETCGGLTLFQDSDYAVHIVPPEEFVPANPVIVGERAEYDISSHWFIVAKEDNGDYLTIDLSRERSGRCYASFWDTHGQPGECPVIAGSFTDLLGRLIGNGGGRWYWLRDDFVSLGDAYDGVDVT